MRNKRFPALLLICNARDKDTGGDVVAPNKVLELIERVNYNLGSYRSGKYNETQVMRNFMRQHIKNHSIAKKKTR